MDFQDWRLFGLITTLFIVYLIAIQNPLTYMFFSLYWVHQVIQATSVQRPKSVFIEWNDNYVSASHAHYMRLNTYVFKYIISLNSGIHHFIKKKRVGPHAGPHHFINARFLVNPFSVVVLDCLMLQHFIDEIPLGTSFYKQRTLSDHFINTFGL